MAYDQGFRAGARRERARRVWNAIAGTLALAAVYSFGHMDGYCGNAPVYSKEPLPPQWWLK